MTIKQLLKANYGVYTTTMEFLRDEIAGTQRLGTHISKKISDKLKEMEIGHYPKELPTSKDYKVRLYLLGTDAEALLESSRCLSQNSDEILRVFLHN